MRLSGRICFLRLVQRQPVETISPSLRISRISASPSVVLPDPDSPTTPSVWPARR
jgi:hypothetical protein